MRSRPSLSRRTALLIVMISPALLGSQFKCVAVSNPTVATARIEQIEPDVLRVGEIMQVAGSGTGTSPLQFSWDFGDGTQTVGVQAVHAYLAPGSYRVTLFVRDSLGNVATDSAPVTVTPRLSSSALSLVLASDAVMFPMAGMYLLSVTTTDEFGATYVEEVAFHVMDAAD